MALDPSKGRSDKVGDFSAFVWGGLDRDGTLWVDADVQRRHTGKIVEDGLAIYRAARPQAFAVEVNQFQELLAQEFLREAGQIRLTLPVYGITNTVSKVVRIRTIGPWLAQRRLRVRNTPGGRLLVQQLRDFPVGSHDDAPDALEMMVRMLDHLLGVRHETGGPVALRA
jgi:predicted phage terminase large subunit-like protein